MNYFNEVILKNMLSWFMSKGIEILWVLFFIIVGWWLINKSRKLIIIFMQRANMEQSVITFLDSLLKVSLRVILILIILPHIGIDTSSIITTLGVSLAAVGLALKDSLSNIASGILMIIYNPFHVGDYIEVDGVSGTVTKVEMMFTTLMSDNNKLIIVPNSKITSQSIVRTSDYNTECCKLEYQIKGDVNIDNVKKNIQRIITLSDKILPIPPAEISVQEKTNDIKAVKVVFWTEKVNKNTSIQNIDKALKILFEKQKLEFE